MTDYGEKMIQRTIELLFEERTTDHHMLNHIFQSLIEFSEHFDVPSTTVASMILETTKRKHFENGIVAAHFMNLMRRLRKGPWMPLSG